jgi:hypothetical protein
MADSEYNGEERGREFHFYEKTIELAVNCGCLYTSTQVSQMTGMMDPRQS